MISAFFLVVFLQTGGVTTIADPNFFKTVEECEAYAENRIILEQDKVATGENVPHKAIYRCVDWGTDA